MRSARKDISNLIGIEPTKELQLSGGPNELVVIDDAGKIDEGARR